MICYVCVRIGSKSSMTGSRGATRTAPAKTLSRSQLLSAFSLDTNHRGSKYRGLTGSDWETLPFHRDARFDLNPALVLGNRLEQSPIQVSQTVQFPVDWILIFTGLMFLFLHGDVPPSTSISLLWATVWFDSNMQWYWFNNTRSWQKYELGKNMSTADTIRRVSITYTQGHSLSLCLFPPPVLLMAAWLHEEVQGSTCVSQQE